MVQYTQKILSIFFNLGLIAAIAFINWRWPVYAFLGDTPLYRFIWLGVFFILLEIGIELIVRLIAEFKLVGEGMIFSKALKKLSKGFYIIPKVVLSNNLICDYIIIGSSGIWLITARDEKGKITFNGDNLVQNETVLLGLLTQALEKSFSLAQMLKSNLQRDFKVSPVIAFSSPQADLSSLPKNIRGVYISGHKNTVSLVEETDVQLLDPKIIEEIIKIIKK